MAKLRIRQTRLARLGVGLGVLAVVGASSLAWACTFQPRIYGIGVQVSPGGPLQVEGSWMPASAPVYVRWNSQAGPTLAEAPVQANGNFSAMVTIPQAKPGVYFLLAVVDGVGIARTPVEIVGSPLSSRGSQAVESGVSAGLWTGYGSSNSALEVAEQSSTPTAKPLLAAGFSLLAVGLISMTAVGLIATARRRKTDVAGTRGPGTGRG